MNDLRRKTLIFAVGTIVAYILLFLFVDRWVDLWVLENCLQTGSSRSGGGLDVYSMRVLRPLSSHASIDYILPYDRKFSC